MWLDIDCIWVWFKQSSRSIERNGDKDGERYNFPIIENNNTLSVYTIPSMPRSVGLWVYLLWAKTTGLLKCAYFHPSFCITFFPRFIFLNRYIYFFSPMHNRWLYTFCMACCISCAYFFSLYFFSRCLLFVQCSVRFQNEK